MTVPLPEEPDQHAFYRLYARLDLDTLGEGWSRDRLIGHMGSQGTPMFTGSCAEIYREKAFGASGIAPAEPLPNAVARGDDFLAFLVHPGLTSDFLRDLAEHLARLIEIARGGSDG